MSQKEIKKALNVLINESIPEAKELMVVGEFEKAEIQLQSICSIFRILIEKVIEEDLICGIVQRFRQSIHTMKLKDLAKITSADCEKIDSLMSKYSNFVHSQPQEVPNKQPTPEELLVDLKSLKEWREEYTKRNVTPAAEG